MGGWMQTGFAMFANRPLLIVAALAASGTGQVQAAGICGGALEAARNATGPYAEDRPFPVQCNWNYIFALEEKMIRLGDLTRRRSAREFDDQIDAAAVKRAQVRVGLSQTGIVDVALFVTYMSLPEK